MMRRLMLMLLVAVVLAGCAPLDMLRYNLKDDQPPAKRAADTVPDPRVEAAFPVIADGYELAPRSYANMVDREGNPSGMAAFLLHQDDCCEDGDTFSYPPSVIARKFTAAFTLREYESSRLEALRENELFLEDTYVTTRVKDRGVTWLRMRYDMALDKASDGEVPDLRATAYVTIHRGHVLELATINAAKDEELVEDDVERMWRAVVWSRLPAVEPTAATGAAGGIVPGAR